MAHAEKGTPGFVLCFQGARPSWRYLCLGEASGTSMKSALGRFGRNVGQYWVRRTSCVSEYEVEEWHEEVFPVLHHVCGSGLGKYRNGFTNKVVINLSEQKAYLIEQDKVILVSPISSGKPGWSTPRAISQL